MYPPSDHDAVPPHTTRYRLLDKKNVHPQVHPHVPRHPSRTRALYSHAPHTPLCRAAALLRYIIHPKDSVAESGTRAHAWPSEMPSLRKVIFVIARSWRKSGCPAGLCTHGCRCTVPQRCNHRMRCGTRTTRCRSFPSDLLPMRSSGALRTELTPLRRERCRLSAMHA